MVPWCAPGDNLKSPTDPKWETLGLDFSIQGQQLSFKGIQVDVIRSVTDSMNLEDSQLPNEGHYSHQHSVEISMKLIQQWIRFLQQNPPFSELLSSHRNVFLFKLLLHRQLLRSYEDARTFEPRRKLYSNRLLSHFCHWIDKVKLED